MRISLFIASSDADHHGAAVAVAEETNAEHDAVAAVGVTEDVAEDVVASCPDHAFEFLHAVVVVAVVVDDRPLDFVADGSGPNHAVVAAAAAAADQSDDDAVADQVDLLDCYCCGTEGELFSFSPAH